MSRIPVIIEALCYLLMKMKRADKIHLVKLMYLADKYHLMNYGRTITGDTYIALANGPAGSRTMDVLEYDPYVLGNLQEHACKLFMNERAYSYVPGKDCSQDNIQNLSLTDLGSLDFSLENFGNRDQWDVVEYTHTLPEWKQYKHLFEKGATKKENINLVDVLSNPEDKYFNISTEHLQISREIALGSFDQVKLDIPFKIRLPIELRSISDYRIAYFQDNNHQNPKPHWFVLIPLRETDEFLIIMITSRYRERIEYYKRTPNPKAACCLVKVSNDEFSFLSKNSAINCNEAERISVKDLVHRIDEEQGFKLEKENVPNFIRKGIVSAIIKSPLQSKEIEKLAKESNPL